MKKAHAGEETIHFELSEFRAQKYGTTCRVGAESDRTYDWYDKVVIVEFVVVGRILSLLNSRQFGRV
jgi:hypothetical protein